MLLLVKLLTSGMIYLAGDDTLAKHHGRKIFGIGIFRDPVRSTERHTSFVLAHNWVILYVVVAVPFLENIYMALPVCSRLRPKQEAEPSNGRMNKRKKKNSSKIDKTMVALMKEMIEMVVSYAPQRQFLFVADAAYSSLLGQLPANVTIVSRIRKDAKLFKPPAQKTGKRGRPSKKGKRLSSPIEMAQSTSTIWEPVDVVIYGERLTLSVSSFTALWYHVCQDILVRVVIVRDPQGKYKDQFFFTQDLSMPLAQVIEIIGMRWTVEVAHHELKQLLGMEQPQARLELAVKRQAPFAMLLLSLVKLWYLIEGHSYDSFRFVKDHWYLHKEGIPFSDMLRLFRSSYWSQRIFSNSNFRHDQQKILSSFIQFFARASCFFFVLTCWLCLF